MEDITRYQKVLENVLAAAAQRDYAGYSKFDALNSPVLERLSFRCQWGRLFWIQAVKAFPLNMRPLLGVQKSRNPKGIALFARAYLFLYQFTRRRSFLTHAEELLEWLADNPSPGYENLCWGYNFIWQSPLFLQERFEPNVVVTVFVGEAFIHAYRVTGDRKYLDSATSVARFILENVPVLYDDPEEMAIAYVLRKVSAVVLNNNVLAGAFLVKLWNETRNPEMLSVATRLLSFTVNRRTDYYAWYYTYPRQMSPLRHDNYHTGGILDGLLEYWEEAGDDRFMDVYWKGLKYYSGSLFEKDGAPRWMNDRRYPHDIHGSAQGIITFSKAGLYRPEYLDQSKKIIEWTVKHLYRAKMNDFVYRKGRFIRWNYSLMRWCNAWMSRAIGGMITSFMKNRLEC